MANPIGTVVVMKEDKPGPDVPVPRDATTASARDREIDAEGLPDGAVDRLNASVTVVLAEDHRIVREGTRQLLDHDPSIRVVGEASTGEEAVRLARRSAALGDAR